MTVDKSTAEAVLFVDDERNVLNAMRRIVEDEAYESYFANSGMEALSIMENHSISVIITDMRMPEMDGLKLLRIVQEKYPDVVRVVLSGYTQLSQILATVNSTDIFRFITKPWNAETDILDVIKSALEYYRLNKAAVTFHQTLESRNLAYQKVLKNLEAQIHEKDIYLQQIRQILLLQRKSMELNHPSLTKALTEFLSEFTESQSHAQNFYPADLLTSLCHTLTEQAPGVVPEMETGDDQLSKLAAPWILLQLFLVTALHAVAPELQLTRFHLALNNTLTARLFVCRLEFSEASGYVFVLKKTDSRLEYLKLLRSSFQEIFRGQFVFEREQNQYVARLEAPAEYHRE